MRRLFASILCLALLAACSPSRLVLNRAADALAAPSTVPEDDLQLVREASAFQLKLSESLLQQVPEHQALAEAVAGGFTQYAYAFVAFDADRLEGRDAVAAQRLRHRAAKLYGRAQRHALAALEQRQSGFLNRLSADTARLDADQVTLAYWAAAAWGARIALSTDQPDLVADLPLAARLARLAFGVAPGHGAGALASLVANFEAARPGGSRVEAARLFDAAERYGAGRNAGVFVARAEALARDDRALFERLLRQALEAAAAHPDLGNQVMGERAQWLLDTIDDRF
ncbi:TRAP transporter TatT component family protein [Pseudorhodoferax sp. LjRoot39]|uniref:TRAP transporter TatT component family protein n=1 Tax=Pseudorhodoferax sp. LjRoot39 TaxID=3342328 RepID=UPI003ECD4E1A